MFVRVNVLTRVTSRPWWNARSRCRRSALCIQQRRHPAPNTAAPDQEESTFDRVLSVDLKGVILCLRYQIRAGGCAIVNTASIAGVIADPVMAPYVAAKHGVIGRPPTTRGRASGSTRWRRDWSSHR
ncbi:MAG: SDR family NAD(P)-dependent oxidoreductase [Longimicrobiales bacterium]